MQSTHVCVCVCVCVLDLFVYLSTFNLFADCKEIFWEDDISRDDQTIKQPYRHDPRIQVCHTFVTTDHISNMGWHLIKSKTE